MKKLPRKKGLHLGINEELYHADRTMVSKSWLDRAAVSPLHLRQYLDEKYVKTLALITGGAVDCLIFTPDEFDNKFVRSPTAKKTTKEGRVEWAEAHLAAVESGRQIVEVHLTDHWLAIHQMADAIMQNRLMAELLKEGVGQATFICQNPDTGLWVKIRPDWYCENRNQAVDLKTAVSASPYEFARSIASYRYHVQDSFYSDHIKVCTGEKPDFLFAVLEKPPKDVRPDPGMMGFYRLTEDEKAAGTDTYLSDLAAIAFAMDNDQWTGYADQVLSIERPRWAQNRDK